MKTFAIFCLFALGMLQVGIAQQRRKSAEPEEEEYSSVLTYGVTTNTNAGILGGFVVRKSTLLDESLFGKKTYQYLSLELVNVRHPKETASTSNTGSRFTFGKMNYLFAIRPQYGRELILSSRTGEEGIAINAILALGPTIGLVKPYVIQYQQRPGVIKTEAYDPIKHANSELIVGTGSFFDGLGQSKIMAGVHGKAALSFELSAFRANLTGIEVGFLGELFAKKVPILAALSPDADRNQSVFTSAYVTLFFGNKK